MQPAPPRPASSSTRPGTSPMPRPPAASVNTQTKVLDTTQGRILCIADIRGRLSGLNDLAREAGAKAIIHTGDFGFFEQTSLERINDRTLRHLTMYSPLIPNSQRQYLLAPDQPPGIIRSTVNVSLLSEFPLLLSGQLKLQIPVYTVWGACEDVAVLEKFRAGTYEIENLHVLDEATTRCLDVGGIKLRLFGLGGALVPHKMFDNGDGQATIAGGQGTMWTTALQIGELVDTAQRVFDQSETRLLVTHASPGREGIIAQLALVLKADLTLSAGLHFRYASSYNEFSVQGDLEGFRQKLLHGKEAFDKVWDSVKSQVDAVIDDNQRVLLDKALSVVERVPPAPSTTGPAGTATGEEPAWKNCWNWNLCDAAYGSLILDVKEGRVSAELKSQGFNYAYRRSATIASPSSAAPTPTIPGNPPAPNVKPSDHSIPPHLPNNTAPTSSAPTPPPIQHTHAPGQLSTSSGKDTPKEGAPKVNGGTTPSDKAEKEKQKRKEKKERKERERAEREAKEKEGGVADDADGANAKVQSKSGKATPSSTGTAPEPDASAVAPRAGPVAAGENDNPLSPAESTGTGIRTPTSRKPPRNPWTIYVKTDTPMNEPELRDFFLEAKSGITRINYPQPYKSGTSKIAYVEFGDEEAMRAGLEKHAEKLNNSVPHVSQAVEKAARQENAAFRGNMRGRGMGRGMGRGGFAARGFAAAGLTGPQRMNSDGGPKDGGGA